MKKLAILAFSVLFLTLSFLSLEFALTHENHNHEDIGHKNPCPVCIIIHSVNNLIKQLFSTVKACLPVIASTLGAFFLLRTTTICFEHYTLVAIKVRIDN